MESSGIVECFMTSERKRKLRYTHYIGDGDSKTHSEIVNNDPYNGLTVEKLECVGHVQKRVGARLRKLKNTDKAKLSDGKPLGGKGRLTEKVINKLQNYFGLAIRQCSGASVYQLKKLLVLCFFIVQKLMILKHNTICVLVLQTVGASIKLTKSKIQTHINKSLVYQP